MRRALEVARAISDPSDASTAFAITRLLVLPFKAVPSNDDTDLLSVAVPDGITNALSSLDAIVVRAMPTNC